MAAWLSDWVSEKMSRSFLLVIVNAFVGAMVAWNAAFCPRSPSRNSSWPLGLRSHVAERVVHGPDQVRESHRGVERRQLLNISVFTCRVGPPRRRNLLVRLGQPSRQKSPLHIPLVGSMTGDGEDGCGNDVPQPTFVKGALYHPREFWRSISRSSGRGPGPEPSAKGNRYVNLSRWYARSRDGRLRKARWGNMRPLRVDVSRFVSRCERPGACRSEQRRASHDFGSAAESRRSGA